MKEPMATLDTRISDRGAVATEWQNARRILETAELFWISTVRADGRPHVTPLVAVWLDEAIHFCTGVTEQKAVSRIGFGDREHPFKSNTTVANARLTTTSITCHVFSALR